MKMTSLLKLTTAAAFFATGALAADHPVTGEKLSANQTYTYRLLDDVKSFDPQIMSSVSDSRVARDLFEGLVNADLQGNPAPGVAKSWDLSEDGQTYTFHLRDNSKWSNGDPVTAHDFVYAWRRLADPATASEYAWYMELMGVLNASDIVNGKADPETLGVTALDDHTLEVKIDQPRPYFPGMLTHASTFPVPQKVIEAHGADWTKPENIVGNGAYTLTDYRSGEVVRRVRNPLYWNNEATILEEVVALVINDENLALTRYRAGELDKTEVPAGQFPALSKSMSDETHSFPRSCSYIYWLNMGENGPAYLKDVNVRKALSYAVNRDLIVKAILKGGQYPSYNWTHQATAGFELPDISMAQMSQAEREAKAKEFLAAAGYGPGNPLKISLSYNTSEGHKKIAIAVSQQWQQVLGVETELANYEWKVHTNNMQQGDYALGRYAWCGDYNEASTYLDLMTSWSGHNNAKYASEEYDAVMKASKERGADTTALYKEAERILSEDVPFIPIYQYTGNIMLKDDIKGFPFEDLLQNIYSRTMYRVEK